MKPAVGEVCTENGEKVELQAKFARLLRYRWAIARNLNENVASLLLIG